MEAKHGAKIMPLIVQRFEFDAGHRVLGHAGKCRHLHGHRYVAEVLIGAVELDDLSMVMDFGKIKLLIGAWIDTNWDHNMILHPDDNLVRDGQFEPLIRDFLEDTYGGRYPYIMPANTNPTAEALARELYLACDDLLTEPVNVLHVRLWETPNCSAVYPDVVVGMSR